MRGHGFDGGPLPYASDRRRHRRLRRPLFDARAISCAGYRWHLDRFGAERAAERLIDHAAYLWRDGLNAVFGMDESGHMDAMGLGLGRSCGRRATGR